MEKNVKELLEFLEQQKGKDVALYDTKGEGCVSDFVVVQHFNSNIENKKFADEFMKHFGIEEFPEGYNRGEWIILDLGECLIHSFVVDKRAKYNLDKLWQNRKVIIKNDKLVKRK